MAQVGWHALMRRVRRLGDDSNGGEPSDGTLLRRFLQSREELAFSLLVDRHGPMVWGVCRRLFGTTQDAEDAFQATFLILVRRAGQLRDPDLLGPWLHGVARRVGLKLRTLQSRRRDRERSLDDIAETTSLAESEWSDLRPLLDDEVGRLPERYRLPFVLCHVQGLTNEEAARRLGCPRGTVLSRLSRARERLRSRLLRRGIVPSSLIVASLLEESAAATMPSALGHATTRLCLASAAGLLPAGASITSVTLSEGVLHTMFLTKVKLFAACMLSLGLLGTTGSVLLQQSAAQGEKGQVAAEAAPAKNLAAPPSITTVPAPVEKKIAGMKGTQIRDELSKIIQFNGVDDRKATLTEVLDSLAIRLEIAIDLNDKAFQIEGIADVGKTPIAEGSPIPGGLATEKEILRRVLARVANATYLIRENHVEITTAPAVWNELRLPHTGNATTSDLPPIVYAEFEEESLESALHAVAKFSDANLVIDLKSIKEVKDVKVNARFHNVSAETAFQILADMGELAMVQCDNVYYITTPEKAKSLKTRIVPKDPPPAAAG